jgi:hydroxymethylpyrimidine/phosphomethylpyrimidine kinase
MTRARVLTIAGSDPSAGAGLQSDLAVFGAFGCHGLAVVAGLTAQDSRGVRSVRPVPDGFVADQLAALFSDGPPAAAKTGMLATAEAVRAVADVFRDHRGTPLVVDPVAASSGGVRLADADAERAIRDQLVPISALVAPNAIEAEALTGVRVADLDGAVAAARGLVAQGARAALVKGGHVGGGECVDVLVMAGAADPILFARSRIAVPRRVRGTGCALSAAIAAGLARGLPMPRAVEVAGDWVHAAIAGAYETGSGALVLDRSVRVPGMPS